MNAIGYIRVSRVGGREGDSFLSPELQRLSIERVCAREGFALLDTVTELDRSGGDAGRPLWNSCVERIERGEAQALVVWNLDRFSRSIVDGFTAIERIEAAGGRLVSEDGATSTLDRGIRLVLAQEYREQVKKGWRRAQASAVERGVAVASKIPLGYTRGVDRRYVVDPATAPAVREAFEMRAQGVSWPRIASYVRGATGRNTNPQAARDVVRNRTYLGDVHYGGMVNEGAHEAIVTRKLYDEANAVRGAKRQGDGTLTASMLLDPTCATCGRRMQATRSRSKGGTIAAYYCPNDQCADRAYVAARDLDPFVARWLFRMLRLVGTTGVRVGDDEADLAEARAAFEAADYDRRLLAENADLRRLIPADEYVAQLEALTVAAAEARLALDLAEGSTAPPTVENIETLWAEWSNGERREWLREMIVSAEVGPSHRGRVPLRERVRAEFRGFSGGDENEPIDTGLVRTPGDVADMKRRLRNMGIS